MDYKELEEGHLTTFMGVEFGTRAKIERMTKRSYVKLYWDDFQQVARIFYNLGKESAED